MYLSFLLRYRYFADSAIVPLLGKKIFWAFRVVLQVGDGNFSLVSDQLTLLFIHGFPLSFTAPPARSSGGRPGKTNTGAFHSIRGSLTGVSTTEPRRPPHPGRALGARVVQAISSVGPGIQWRQGGVRRRCRVSDESERWNGSN